MGGGMGGGMGGEGWAEVWEGGWEGRDGRRYGRGHGRGGMGGGMGGDGRGRGRGGGVGWREREGGLTHILNYPQPNDYRVDGLADSKRRRRVPEKSATHGKTIPRHEE
jgi:hypothetical protein